MTPAKIIEALSKSPDAINIILHGVLTDYDREHYWALSIEDEKIKVHYEYFGHRNFVPHEFIDRRLIPLHSHVPLNVPEVFLKEIKKKISHILEEELDAERRTISGTTNPSHHDLMGFILHGFTSFGIVSKYKDFVKVSFYDPTILQENDLRDILTTVINLYEKTDALVDDESTSMDDIIDAIKRNVEIWNYDKKLQILCNEPYAAHLFIPI